MDGLARAPGQDKASVFNAAGVLITLLFAAFCLIPMILVFSASISDEAALMKYGFSIIPRGLSISAYKMILLGDPLVLNSYMVSVIVTVCGTTLATTITGMAAFSLANKKVRLRNTFAIFFFITMIFNPGLVPWYFMNKALGLQNNLLALIVPRLLFTPFNLFLTRNFMKGIPDSLMESAWIDGANDITIAFKIYFPLSLPVIATITLFYGLGYWNDWFNAIMLVESQRLYPVQYLLFRLQSEIGMLTELSQAGESDYVPPSESFKMATAIVTIGPIILLYPYLQRYFVRGLVVGSIKG